MRFLTFLVSLLLATMALQIAVASPIESNKTIIQVEVAELATALCDHSPDPKYNVTGYDVESASNVTREIKLNNHFEESVKSELSLDSIFEKLLKSRDSMWKVIPRFYSTFRSADSLVVFYFVFLSSLGLYSALGAASGASGAYILHPNNLNLIHQAAFKGCVCNAFDFLIRSVVSLLTFIPYGGYNPYYVGIISAPILSTVVTAGLGLSGSFDTSTTGFAVYVGAAISWVVFVSHMVTSFASSHIFKIGGKMDTFGSSIVLMFVTSACAAYFVAYLTNANPVASVFMATISLNPSIVGMLPMINNETLKN